MESEIETILLSATFLFLFFSLMILLILYLYRNAKRKHFMEQEAMHNAFESELLRSELEISEAVTTRLSQELHDDLGQLLSHSLHLHQQSRFDELGELLKRIRKDVRNISHSLHGAKITELGLDLALERLCNATYGSYTPPCTYSSTDERIELSKEEELILFRCVQQSIENAYKHAEATKIDVKLQLKGNQLLLCVEDDGKGFKLVDRSDGIGLISIRNRVQMMNGTLEIHTEHGVGTRITISKELNK